MTSKQSRQKWKKDWKLFPITKPVRHRHYQDVGYGLLLKGFQIEFVEMYYEKNRLAVKPLAWFELDDIDKIIQSASSLKKYLEELVQ